MALLDLKEALEIAHVKLIDQYGELRQALKGATLPEDASVRDEVWRASQHLLRAALIADTAARHVDTKMRRLELENSFYLPDPYEADPFAVDAQDTAEIAAAKNEAPALIAASTGDSAAKQTG